jgi:hypothetical protein
MWVEEIENRYPFVVCPMIAKCCEWAMLCVGRGDVLFFAVESQLANIDQLSWPALGLYAVSVQSLAPL